MRLVPTSSGITDVKATAAQTDNVVTLDGRRATDGKALSKGVYIVNGKKAVVK